jgi:hypothetical protein
MSADGAGATQTNIDIAEILTRIPHRYPFLLVDRAEDYRPHESIIGIKCVTVNEPFFVGHFPGNPVMPGVLIVEALAQSGAVLMSKSLNADVAVRNTDYSVSGDVTTWKAGGDYQIIDDIRLRGTVSRDIRAPNLLELYNASTQATNTQQYP